MPFLIKSHRLSDVKLKAEAPGASIVDVTSHGPQPWVRLSPFYPHGKIPIPYSGAMTAASVEGIWQGLKVFEKANVDIGCFENTTMKGMKRSTRRFGAILGHRKGVRGTEILSYADARRLIYLPAIRYVLENRCADLVAGLRELSTRTTVVLLDYETNDQVDDLSRPLSHAGLIIQYAEERWPESSD